MRQKLQNPKVVFDFNGYKPTFLNFPQFVRNRYGAVHTYSIYNIAL